MCVKIVKIVNWVEDIIIKLFYTWLRIKFIEKYLKKQNATHSLKYICG